MSHETPHDDPLQVGEPWAGSEHEVQELPQVAVELLLTQLPPQSWVPLLQA